MRRTGEVIVVIAGGPEGFSVAWIGFSDPKWGVESKGPIIFKYTICFPDGREKEFAMHLDRKTCALIQSPRSDTPAWTRLGYEKCRNCPLSQEEHPCCPVAVSVVDLIEFFSENRSVEAVEVVFESEQRSFRREGVPLSAVISSLLGIHMVSSGCPILNHLRPMVRHHLPFADMEETTFRAISTYLLGEYFRHKRGEAADWSLDGLSRIYKEINLVNKSFGRRLAFGTPNEATANAIANLDCFAHWIEMSINEEMLDDLEDLAVKVLFHDF